MRRYGCEWLWRLDNCGLCRHWLLPAGGQGSSGGGCRLPKPNIQSQTCSYCSHVTKPNSVMSATYRRLLKANITSLATQTEYITIGSYWFHRSQTQYVFQGKSAAYLTLFIIGRMLPRLRYYIIRIMACSSHIRFIGCRWKWDQIFTNSNITTHCTIG